VNCKEPKTTCRKCGRSGYLQEFCEQISSRSPHFPKESQDARRQNQNKNTTNNYKNYEQFRSTYNSKPNYKSSSISISINQPRIKRQSSNPKFKHQKSRRSKDHDEMQEPCFNRAYLIDLLDTGKTYIDFYQDDLCAMGDSIEDQEDEEEVWFPTEDHDEYESVSKPEIMAGFSRYSNLQSSQLPHKIPVIYSTITYLTNNSQKKSPTASVSALQSNSPIYNGQQTDRTSVSKLLIYQNFYESTPTYQHQPTQPKQIHT